MSIENKLIATSLKMDQVDLKIISTAISSPPFNRRLSIIQLHDELSAAQLLDIIFEVAAFIDEASKPSVFLPDGREIEEKVFRLVEFLRMLKYVEAAANL